MAHPELLGSYWTLAAGADPMGDQRCLHDFRKRVEIAAKAGFSAMGFWHADIEETIKHYSFKEMKEILNDNGITKVEVEWLLDWFCRDSRRVASDQTRELLLEAAESLGAQQIKIGDLGNDCAEIPQLTEEFAVLCDQAAKRGTNVLFELLPAQFSRAPTLDLVLKICQDSGAKNGGLVLDVHHLHRTNTPPQDVAKKIPRNLPLAVELNDGASAMPKDLQDYVVNRRLFPGDGEFDLNGYLAALWTQGFAGPIGVEVINEYVRYWPLELAAEHAYAKTRRVVNAAHDQWEATQRTQAPGTRQ